MSPGLKRFLLYSGVVLIVSVAYFAYVWTVHSPSPERETFLSEIGEGVGEVAMWAFVFIYTRTALKLTMGKGPIAKRLLPQYSAPESFSRLQRLIVYLDRSHIYFGVAALALALIHIGLMGLRPQILFFPLVLALIVWQGVFGLALSWRGAPRDLKRWSYSVHAQLVTGVMIGVFAYFGHMLIED